MKKYYFIYYECYKVTWKDNVVQSNVTMKCQDLCDIHPIQYQVDFNEEYGKEHDNGYGGTTRETCLIMFWKELTGDEYSQFEWHVG